MSLSRTIIVAAGAATAGFLIGATGLAVAFDPWGQSQWSYMKGKEAVAELGNNEGVYVDKATFKLTMGAAKGDPIAQIAKMGGKEVAEGAIIFRSGTKLYVVDGKPTDKN